MSIISSTRPTKDLLQETALTAGKGALKLGVFAVPLLLQHDWACTNGQETSSFLAKVAITALRTVHNSLALSAFKDGLHVVKNGAILGTRAVQAIDLNDGTQQIAFVAGGVVTGVGFQVCVLRAIAGRASQVSR